VTFPCRNDLFNHPFKALARFIDAKLASGFNEPLGLIFVSQIRQIYPFTPSNSTDTLSLNRR
jgi:hypothetical protein